MSLARFVNRSYGNTFAPGSDINQAHVSESRDLDLLSIKVSGRADFSGPVSVPTPISDEQACNKVYVDSMIAAKPVYDILDVSGTLEVHGKATFHGGVTVQTPQSGSEVCNKDYADDLAGIAGLGLQKEGKVFSVKPLQNHVLQVGPLKGLMVEGPAVFASTITVRDPVDESDVCTRRYVDKVIKAQRTQYVTPQDGDRVTIAGEAAKVTLILDAPMPIDTLIIQFPDKPADADQISILATTDVVKVHFDAAGVVPPPIRLVPRKAVTFIFVSDVSLWFEMS